MWMNGDRAWTLQHGNFDEKVFVPVGMVTSQLCSGNSGYQENFFILSVRTYATIIK